MPTDQSGNGIVRSEITTADRGDCWLIKCDSDAKKWVYDGDDFAAKVCDQCHDHLTDLVHWEDGNDVV